MTETVLLVEDDMTNRLLVEAVLSSVGGFDVIGTDDGDRVLELIESRDFAAIVMDVSLRSTEVAGDKVDGVELTRRIRQLDRGAQLPIILLTAHAMTGDRERLLFSSGANDYVPKPITDPNAFVTLLRTHIDTFGDLVAGSPPRGSA
jgi:CheY-like chemotaxis protein